MHIPDGLLDPKTLIGSAALAAAGVSYATWRVRRDLDSREVPRVAVLTAFIFAAQMVNFPIPGGTSGHLMGGALAAVLFGPWVSMVVMTTVVAVQALVFQDGGIAALGANLLNMAVIGPLVGYGVYRLLKGLWSSRAGWLAAVFLSGLVSVVAGAAGAALMLALSGVIPLAVGLPAMGLWHLMIGVGEGIITAAVAAYVTAERPELQPEVRHHD
ncbi:MAG TPA: energy-coupling factor ABC transporter permease [Symbiobacteriaceae bacterium]